MTSPFDDPSDLHDTSEPIVVGGDDLDAFAPASAMKSPIADSAAKKAPQLSALVESQQDHGHDDIFGAGGDHDGKGAGSGGDEFAHVNGDESHAQDPFASSSDHVDDGYSSQPKEPEDIFAPPTALSLWEKDRKLVLEERIRKAQAAKVQAQEDAKQEITKFYAQRQETLVRNQATNRADEKNTKADMDALMKGGTLWEKVGKLANLQPKAGQDGKTTRMRKLLIQLKNDKVDYDDGKH